MEAKIKEVKDVLEKKVIITYDDDGFEERITLIDEEYDAFMAKNTKYFEEEIKSSRDGYDNLVHEISEYIATFNESETVDSHDIDTVVEMLRDLEATIGLIKVNNIVLQALEA